MTENGTGPGDGAVMSSSIASLAAALVEAQKSYQPLVKNKTAHVRMKAGGTYSYAYASLEDVFEAVRTALGENGLAFTQPIIGNHLLSILMHSSGEWLSSEVELPRMAEPQALGSYLTYVRRYAAVSLLGIAAEEDDDAQAARQADVQTGRQVEAYTKTDATTEKRVEPQLVVPKDWRDLVKGIDEIVNDPANPAKDWLNYSLMGQYGVRVASPTDIKTQLTEEQQKDAFERALKVWHELRGISPPGSFPPPTARQSVIAWNRAFEGLTVKPPPEQPAQEAPESPQEGSGGDETAGEAPDTATAEAEAAEQGEAPLV